MERKRGISEKTVALVGVDGGESENTSIKLLWLGFGTEDTGEGGVDGGVIGIVVQLRLFRDECNYSLDELASRIVVSLRLHAKRSL